MGRTDGACGENDLLLCFRAVQGARSSRSWEGYVEGDEFDADRTRWRGGRGVREEDSGDLRRRVRTKRRTRKRAYGGPDCDGEVGSCDHVGGEVGSCGRDSLFTIYCQPRIQPEAEHKRTSVVNESLSPRDAQSTRRSRLASPISVCVEVVANLDAHRTTSLDERETKVVDKRVANLDGSCLAACLRRDGVLRGGPGGGGDGGLRLGEVGS